MVGSENLCAEAQVGWRSADSPRYFFCLVIHLALACQPLKDSNELSRKQEVSSHLGSTCELVSLLLLEAPVSLWG